MSERKKLVEVYRACSEAEGRIIQGLLESNGIPSVLQGNAAPSVHAFAVDGLGEVKVMVWETHKESAAKLIRSRDNA